MRSRSPCSKRTIRAQLAARRARRRPRAARSGGRSSGRGRGAGVLGGELAACGRARPCGGRCRCRRSRPRARGTASLADGGEREGLGAVGAAGAPGAHAAGLAASSGRICVLQHVPLLRVAPQLRDVDRHAVQEGVELVGVAAQQVAVDGQARRRRGAGPRCARGAPSGRACTAAGRRRRAADPLAERGVVVGVREPGVAAGVIAAGLPRRSRRAARASGSTCVGEAGLGDRARHAVDGAGRLVLDEDAAAGGADGARRPRGRRGPCRSARRAASARAVEARRRRRS